MKGKVAAVILVNNKKKILLYLRDNKQSIPYPNFWSLLGGHLKDEENWLEALKREIKEEINYKIQNPTFIGSLDDRVGNLVFIYRADINKKINELELTEGQKLGFFSFSEVLKLKIPKLLKDFLIKNKDKILN